MDNRSLHERKNRAIARGQGTLTSVYIDHASNAELWDIEGRRYIDFGAGIAVLNVGHGNSRVMDSARAQLDKFNHTCMTVTPYVVAVELAERLNAIVPGRSAKKTILVTTGAEAVENAIKIARAYTGRPGAIAFHGSFHGRTNLALGLTGKDSPYKIGYGPFPSEIVHVPFPNTYHGVSVGESLGALDRVFTSTIEPDKVAAIVIEPVQGEGGFYRAPPEFMQSLRSLCDRHGILLICDEIQTGFARTGKMFATEYSGIEPDLMTIAKGLAGGFPLAGVVGKSDIMDAPAPGGLGGTYGGSPIGCAAALAVLDVIEEEGLCQRAIDIGDRFVSRLRAIQEKYPDQVGDVRNLGAMIAMELVRDGDASSPDTELTGALIAEAAKNGLILLPCGMHDNVIRFLPPLTITDELISEGLDLFEKSLQALVPG